MAELRVRRDDLAVCELVEGERLRERLGEGEAAGATAFAAFLRPHIFRAAS